MKNKIIALRKSQEIITLAKNKKIAYNVISKNKKSVCLKNVAISDRKRVCVMIVLSLMQLQKLASVKSEKELRALAKKESFVSAIVKQYDKKIADRKNLQYVNQKSQVMILHDNILKKSFFVVTNTKHTTNKMIADVFAIEKNEVIKLQNLKMQYDNFKNLFANVAKYVLCVANVKHNLAKHERFYSQCLAEVNQILTKRFTESIIHSRSTKIKVKQITLDNVTKSHSNLMSELLNKAKSKTSKLVKAKTQKKEKVKA